MGRLSVVGITFGGAAHRTDKRVAFRIRFAIRSKRRWHPTPAFYLVNHVRMYRERHPPPNLSKAFTGANHTGATRRAIIWLYQNTEYSLVL